MVCSASLHARQVVAHSARFWRGEYDIGLRYFALGSPYRSVAADRRWLEFQMFKEWTGSGVYGPRGFDVPGLIRDALAKVNRADPLNDTELLSEVCDELEFVADELRHYVMLTGLRNRAWPERSRLSLAEMGNVVEGTVLTELRYDLRGSECGEMAVALSEGGGLGLYFAILDVLEPRAETLESYDSALLDATRRIVADERGHLAYNFCRATANVTSPNEWREIDALLQKICWQKLKERNDQFGGVLTEEEMEDARAGRNGWQPFVDAHLNYLLAHIDEAATGVEAPSLELVG